MSCTVGVVTVVPSPYQRDLFAAMSRLPGVNLRVGYMEAAAPDSPWPEKPLAPYERILPGFWFPIGRARCHVNWAVADLLRGCNLVILNSLMSLTAQTLARTTLRHRPWIFWGERLGSRRTGWHEALTAPLHRAKAIAGIGSLATQDYRSRFPEPRHYSVPYFCDLTPFLSAPTRVRGDELVILFCGQMIARKGVDLLLTAFARLAERHANVRLKLVGREAELPDMLAPLPSTVRSRIEYCGFQAPDALPRFFSEADVFVLPSRYDGWGVVVNQALGAGLPIVCSDAVGAAHDLIEREVNGEIFPSGDADALFKILDRLARAPEIAARWGAASRRQAAAWSPERGAERWLAIFNKVLGA